MAILETIGWMFVALALRPFAWAYRRRRKVNGTQTTL